MKSTSRFILRHRDAITNIVPLVFTVLALGISIYQSLPEQPTPYTHSQVLSAIYTGAAIGILIFLITNKVSTWINESEIASNMTQQFDNLGLLIGEHARSVERQISGEGRIVCLGHPNDAIARIAASIMDARNARNVHVSHGNVRIFRYPAEKNRLVVESIRTFLAKAEAGNWIDIISHPEETENRMKDVFSGMPKAVREKYHCYKLKEKWPVLNFLVLSFGGGRDREVYVGFGRHPADEVGNVFYSTDEKVVDMFDRWHATLRRDEVSSVHDLKATGSGIT